MVMCDALRNVQEDNKKQGRAFHFKGIAGLKIIAAIMMFLWHSPVQQPAVDLGARLCEFFFVTSGFLFAISNIPKADALSPSFVSGYMRRKLVQMWPVHFVGFLAAVFLFRRTRCFCHRHGSMRFFI